MEESKQDVLRGAAAIEDVTQLLEAQEKLLRSERRSFNQIADYSLKEDSEEENSYYNMENNNNLINESKAPLRFMGVEHDNEKSFEQKMREINEKAEV